MPVPITESGSFPQSNWCRQQSQQHRTSAPETHQQQPIQTQIGVPFSPPTSTVLLGAAAASMPMSVIHQTTTNQVPLHTRPASERHLQQNDGQQMYRNIIRTSSMGTTQTPPILRVEAIAVIDGNVSKELFIDLVRILFPGSRKLRTMVLPRTNKGNGISKAQHLNHNNNF